MSYTVTNVKLLLTINNDLSPYSYNNSKQLMK
jgi:hypothetical protein